MVCLYLQQNLEAERRFKSQLPSEVGATGVTDEVRVHCYSSV